MAWAWGVGRGACGGVCARTGDRHTIEPIVIKFTHKKKDATPRPPTKYPALSTEKNYKKQMSKKFEQQSKKAVSEAIKKELKYRLKNEKYRFYTPIGKVEEFVSTLLSGDYMVGALLAANGVGKTTALINLIAHMCYPTGNKYFQQPLLLDWPYPKRGRIASDPTTIRETIVPALKEWLPEGRYKTWNRGKNYPAYWETETGWSFDLMTYDQDVKEFESTTLGFVFFDEPPPEAIYKASIARLRKGGMCGIFATPLMGSAWMYDEIVANPRAKEQFRFFMEAEIEEACKIHGVRGFLDHEVIERMIAQYTDEDMVARVFGKFQHLSGIVFKSFDPHTHVIPAFELNRAEYSVTVHWDTHARVNEAIVWIATDKNGRNFVIDELWSGAPLKELVAQFKHKDAQYRTEMYLMDPSGFIEDKRTGKSFHGSLTEKYGLHFQQGSKRRAAAISAIEDALHYRVVGSEMQIKPELYFFHTCEKTVWEFQHWQWQEYSGKTAEKKDKNPRPEDKDDHFIEGVGRILLEETGFVPNYRDNDGDAFQDDVSNDPY